MNQLLTSTMSKNVLDIKTLNLVLECLTNFAMSGPLIAQKITKETCILEAIKCMLENSNIMHSEVIQNVITLVLELIKY